MGKARVGIEILLATLAATAVASFAGCGGKTEGDGTSNGGSGPSDGPGSSSGLGSSSGGKAPAERPDGTCENGKDVTCGCSLPDFRTVTLPYRGPPAPDGGADGGDAGTVVPWTCDDECEGQIVIGRKREIERCSYDRDDLPTQVSCTYWMECTGRRPAGAEPIAAASTRSRDLLAAMASLEEASIHAFVRLARELAHHRAPPALVARAREAAFDEVRHTRAMHRLAKAFGSTSARPRSRSGSRRVPRLVDILVENAVEGCVRETFGAAMAHVQALRATDPAVREAMTEIATDESRHAELSWAILEWGYARCTQAERRRIDEAQNRAVRMLVEEIERGADEPTEPVLGLASPTEAKELASALDRQLWAA